MSLKDFRSKIYRAVNNSAFVGEHAVNRIVDSVVAAFIPERTKGFRLDRIEQVAMYVPDIGKAKLAYSRLGMDNWVDDIVTGEVTITDSRWPITRAISKAHLSFNYDLGFELELIRYLEGPNWHSWGMRVTEDGQPWTNRPFMSHMSYHVESIEDSMALIEAVGFKLVQTMTTTSHTNQYLINNGRRFRYAIFDSRDILGWDIKLIERIEAQR